jgi:hypothetical protein
MKIDTTYLQNIISKLPDANTYQYNAYIVIKYNGLQHPQEIIFDRYNFTDGIKRWIFRE